MSVALTWGTSPAERARAYACGKHVERAEAACYRGVTVNAPAALLFQWLRQLRVAPYSYDWIDNGRRRSPRALQRAPALARILHGWSATTTLIQDEVPGHKSSD